MIKWLKNLSNGDIYTNDSGTSWRFNGKAWVSMRKASPNNINYQFSHSPMDPVDNMVYFIGDITDSPAQSNSSITSRRVKSLAAGYVKQVSIMTQILGNVGSNEHQTFTLKNYTTGNSSVITSIYSNDSNSKLDNYLLDKPLQVSLGDELEIIWIVNIFETSPTGVRHNFTISIEI